MKTKKFSNKGFTLIELLITISVLIILMGVALSLINPNKLRRNARDAVRLSYMQKLVTGIEAYANANGSYPASSASGDWVMVTGHSSPNVYSFNPGLPEFILQEDWPDGLPAAGDPSTVCNYIYAASLDKNTFGIRVCLEKDGGGFNYKYRSDWSNPTISLCKNTDATCCLPTNNRLCQ